MKQDQKVVLFIDVDGTLMPLDTDRVSTDVKKRLQRILHFSEVRVDPVWCTAWLEDADAIIGPQVGLNGVPYLPFLLPWDVTENDYSAYGLYKVPDMADYVHNYKYDAAIVLDDEIEHSVDLESHLGVPALLVKTDPVACLTDAETDAVIFWLRQL